ncbi:hypothetical protein Taro_013729 [Colocasia esculenta]|uniref:Uncharacterized protein n=1 Tax=Colocasia esculenta TaxID=4460 RepID=A0A843UHA7_COLES|nr:hypothetical protein [Colocasia esculenta]
MNEYLEETIQDPSKVIEPLGDSVAWGGCAVMYLLGQHLHFELFDFSYQFLNVSEVENATLLQNAPSERAKSPNLIQGYDLLLEAMRKARRLNNHVFSMLRARCPLEDKIACAIKQSGAPLHRGDGFPDGVNPKTNYVPKLTNMVCGTSPTIALSSPSPCTRQRRRLSTLLHRPRQPPPRKLRTRSWNCTCTTSSVAPTPPPGPSPACWARSTMAILVPFASPLGFFTPRMSSPSPTPTAPFPLTLVTGLSGTAFSPECTLAARVPSQLGPDGLGLGFAFHHGHRRRADGKVRAGCVAGRGAGAGRVRGQFGRRDHADAGVHDHDGGRRGRDRCVARLSVTGNGEVQECGRVRRGKTTDRVRAARRRRRGDTAQDIGPYDHITHCDERETPSQLRGGISEYQFAISKYYGGVHDPICIAYPNQNRAAWGLSNSAFPNESPPSVLCTLEPSRLASKIRWNSSSLSSNHGRGKHYRHIGASKITKHDKHQHVETKTEDTKSAPPKKRKGPHELTESTYKRQRKAPQERPEIPLTGCPSRTPESRKGVGEVRTTTGDLRVGAPRHRTRKIQARASAAHCPPDACRLGAPEI